MIFLPMVGRELRVASRRPRTYWGRSIAALLALSIGGYVYVSRNALAGVQLGSALFIALVWLAFFSCVLSGVRHTAECLSNERRDGTLGLLFLTDLHGYDIILGKLAAAAVSVLQGLLAIAPIIAIPLLMGGVTAIQVARVVAALLAISLYSLAVGMFVSGWFENGRRAVGVTTIVLLVVTLGPWVAGSVWATAHQAFPPEYLLLPSPAWTLALAIWTGFPGGLAGHFGWGLLLLAGQAIGLLALTSTVLPRFCHDRSESRRRTRWRAAWQRWRDGTAATQRAFRARLLASNPFFWLAARDRRAPLYVWAFVGVSACVWAAVLASFPDFYRELEASHYLLLSMFLHVVLRCWLASAATQRLAEDRRTGALELVLATPLSTNTILAGQARALLRQFGGPLGAVLLLDLFACWRTTQEVLVDQDLALPFYGARGLMLLADVSAIAYDGMWRGIQGRTSTQAASATLARVLALPWVVLMGLAWLADQLDLERRWNWANMDRIALLTWFLIGLGTDAVLVLSARVKLHSRFRRVATEPPARARRWRGLFGSD